MNRSSSNNRSRTNKPFSIVKIFSELKEEEGTSSFLRSKFTDLQEEEEEDMTLESGETLSPGSPTASLSSSSSSSSLQWAEDVSQLTR
jgi:hypothetical protein